MNEGFRGMLRLAYVALRNLGLQLSVACREATGALRAEPHRDR